VLTFFVLMDAEALHQHLISLLPPSERPRAQAMSAKMGRKIEGWLKGILLLSLFIGVIASIGMWVLGMPYPLLLGLAAGIFELVPMVGAYLGAAPAVFVALFQPTWKLIAVIVFYIVVQQVENNVLVPKVMGQNVEMPPLLAIVALLTGAALMGILGAMLAVPVAAILQVLWIDLVVPEIRSRHEAQGTGHKAQGDRETGYHE
jgi:predicted PurR-regulated permease PerM